MDKEKRQKFLKSGIWKKFRLKVAEKDGSIDFITQKKLRKGFQCHHLRQNKEEYSNLDNIDDFICLNKATHDCIHFLYTYYKSDPEIIERLKIILERMNNRD